MRPTVMFLIPVFLLFSILSFASGDDAGDILGTWLTTKSTGHKVHIEIYKNKEFYNGKICWLEEAVYPQDDVMAGNPKVDRNNPDTQLRTRPIIGLEILTGFTYDGNNKWKGGRIYDPENGKTYKCKMTITDEGELKIRGYIGFSMLGRTSVWKRVDTHE